MKHFSTTLLCCQATSASNNCLLPNQKSAVIISIGLPVNVVDERRRDEEESTWHLCLVRPVLVALALELPVLHEADGDELEEDEEEERSQRRENERRGAGGAAAAAGDEEAKPEEPFSCGEGEGGRGKGERKG